MNAMPPDPAFRGDGWRDEWLARLEATPPWLIEWLRQQHDGPYWRQGSLAPGLRRDRGGDPARRRLDGLRTSMPRSGCRRAARRRSGRSSATGSTACPSSATPGPNLDELHELVRFFDRWLKGIPNGVDDEPADRLVRARLRRAGAVPGGAARAAGGRPAPIRTRRSARASGGSAAAPLPLVGGLVGGRRAARRRRGIDRYRHRPTVGTRAALSWGAGGRPTASAATCARTRRSARPTRRRRSSAPVAILGVPEVVLHLAVSAPVATRGRPPDRRRARRDARPRSAPGSST